MSLEPLVSEYADDPDMQEILQEFVAGLSETVDQLRAALGQGDVDLVRRLGHQMKGAGGGYGFHCLTEAGTRLEQTAAAEKAITSPVQEAADELVRLCQRVQAGVA